MPTPNPYFLYPFCVNGGSGDITPIDNTTVGGDSGIVNYQFGFTPNYEYPSSNPSNLPVPRQQFNQLMFDITTALQQIQLQGFPLWVAPASGSPPVGGPSSYPIYATVAYNAGSGIQLWQSVIGSNTSVPGADNNWLLISGNAQGVQPGTIIDFAGPYAPAGYLFCNGSAYSRTTYANLYNAITQVQSCTLSASINVIVAQSFSLYVGMAVEGTNIPNNTTVASIIDATHITISNAATGSGTTNLRFFQWGNGDGSTTFNIPNLTGKYARGAYGSVITGTNGIGSVPGQSGGGDSYTQILTDMPDHRHNVAIVSNNLVTGGPPQVAYNTFQASPQTINILSDSVYGYTPQTAMPTIPRSAILLKCIKY